MFEQEWYDRAAECCDTAGKNRFTSLLLQQLVRQRLLSDYFEGFLKHNIIMLLILVVVPNFLHNKFAVNGVNRLSIKKIVIKHLQSFPFFSNSCL